MPEVRNLNDQKSPEAEIRSKINLEWLEDAIDRLISRMLRDAKDAFSEDEDAMHSHSYDEILKAGTERIKRGIVKEHEKAMAVMEQEIARLFRRKD